MDSFHGDEIDEAFLEFRRESCKSAALSAAIVREIVTILRRGTNTIKRNRYAHVEDEPEDMAVDNAGGGNIGSSPTQYDNSLLRHRRHSEGISGVGRLSADLSSTLENPFDYDGQHRLGGRPASNQPIAMRIRDEEDSTMQQNQAILSMYGQEQATDDIKQGRGRLDESYATGSVGVQKSSGNHIGHLAREHKATSIPSHCDCADTEQSDIPANSLSSPSGDEGQSGDPPQGLKRLLRKLSEPAGVEGLLGPRRHILMYPVRGTRTVDCAE